MHSELWNTLDGPTPAKRRASIAAAQSAYARRCGAPPTTSPRVFRVGRKVYIAYTVTFTHRSFTEAT